MEKHHNNHYMSHGNTTTDTPPESPIEDVEQSKKTAEKVDWIFYTFDRAVDWLIEQGKQWNNVYINWNNETLLYSCEIKTRDDAYMIYYWITELERKKKIEALQKQREAEALRRELELLDWRDNFDTWKKYIPKPLWKEWEKDLKTDNVYTLMHMKEELEDFMNNNQDNCRNIST